MHRETLIARLDELGINRLQSHRWQREASISTDEFEGFCRDLEGRDGELCSAALLRFVRSLHQNPRQPYARRRANGAIFGYDPHSPPAERVSSTSKVMEAMTEMRNHLESLDRMCAEICRRPTSYLKRIERREIPRYLQETLARLAEIESELSGNGGCHCREEQSIVRLRV